MEQIPSSQPPTEEVEELSRTLYKNWREHLVNPLLIGTLVFGLFALIPAVIGAKALFISIVFVAAYIVICVITFINFPYWVKMSGFVTMIYALGLSELATHGILGDGLFFFLGTIIFSSMLFSPTAGIIVTAINLLTFLVFGVLTLTGVIVPINQFALHATLADWLSAAGAVLLFAAVIVICFRKLEAETHETEARVESTLGDLRKERNTLENRVKNRTRQLKKVNDIAQTVSSILNPDELVSRATFMIGDEMESYYTALYLIDPSGQWAELREATGDAGKVLKENKQRIDLKGETLVAVAIRSRQTRLALNTGADSGFISNPLLPYTRSQLAAPLIVGDKLFGALELHSTKESAYTPDDLDTYQNMANQVAIALENSRLFRESQQSLFELRSAQRQYLQSSWTNLIEEKPLEYEIGDDEETSEKEVLVPLSLRDQIIGQISMSTAEEWTPEQRSLIESIAAQAALALENARLVEESQIIASQERITNEIIAKIWASNNTESILQTAVRELGRVLEAAEVDIEVTTSVANE
ncbi:MAG: GAF domain-containing protein [Anaerolineales bacterium]|nr:GAF domain-containing protein [Anaerolineales bacterium]